MRTVGIVGLGIMGSAMAANLMRAGYEVVGYDVRARRRQEHRRAGGEVALRVGDIRAATVICSLPSSEALLQTASELAKARRPPRIVIETSTLPVAIKEKARRKLEAAGTTLLDCPLSGTGAQARQGDLVVYASGDSRAWRRVVPVVNTFARAYYYVGPFGAGSKMKFVANLLVAIHNVAAAEALVLGAQAGLDPKLVLRAISDGAGTSRMLEVRGPMMVNGNYANASMKLDVWQKDLTIIAAFARDVAAPTPLFSASAPFYMAAMSMGRQQEDTAAVHAVLVEMGKRLARRRQGRPQSRPRRDAKGRRGLKS
jgi:3-hydroxyisobutyrate dehydrogenase-like beta-hydroxyacid dehydrogenase